MLYQEIKPRIEKMLLWFVPVLLISTAATYISGKNLEVIASTLAINPEGYRASIANYMLLHQALAGLDNLVVAVWLFWQAKFFRFNRFVWPIFGLIQPFFAILIFLVVLLVENKRTSIDAN